MFNKVKTCDQFRYRMLDLQPCIHFQKIEISILVDDKFNSAHALIIHRGGKCDGLRAHRGARFLVQKRTWRFFKNFLIAPLNGTFAFAEMNNMTVRVRQDLKLDMARRLDIFFYKNTIITKTGFGLRPGRRKSLRHIVFRKGNAHALAATPRGRFNHHRIADLIGNADGLAGTLDNPGMTGNRVDICLGRKRL